MKIRKHEEKIRGISVTFEQEDVLQMYSISSTAICFYAIQVLLTKIQDKELGQLLDRDQLRKAQKDKQAFCGFSEYKLQLSLFFKHWYLLFQE